MLSAGAIRGVPPPPGYPGLVWFGHKNTKNIWIFILGAAQPIGPETNLPPTEANYPRQKSTLQK